MLSARDLPLYPWEDGRSEHILARMTHSIGSTLPITASKIAARQPPRARL